jgi:1-acyl-sn-glycerol-3-phosphate acyltransferase
MNFLKTLYTVYAFILFVLAFLLLFPLFLIPIAFPKLFKLVGVINRIWAWIYFPIIGLPWHVEYRQKLDPTKRYIFCPNHFSYLDIAIMGLNSHNTIFVGKSQMEKIPLFGYMYRHLHITVDRDKLSSKYSTFTRSLAALDAGKSLVIFPEGGIVTHRPPTMGRFKDGPFRAAIEKQVQLVPVTIPYNWIILPDTKYLRLHWKPMKLIFHEPIDPANYTLKDVDTFKEKVYHIIDTELKKQLVHEHYPRTS